LREKTLAAAEQLSGEGKVIVFACREGGDFSRLQAKGVAVVALPCIAMLPPSFIDFVISKHHAEGVFLTGCEATNCYHRYGTEWVEQRIRGERDPQLRKRVPRERLQWLWAGQAHNAQLVQELSDFRSRLKKLPPHKTASMSEVTKPVSSEAPPE
ncbi:MAG: hydrogenase iron-sulfur subunit, partial [Gammaproteobacteria bacterium]|nr:hydrogenase iron-sulfur subunit [Gammaproteobacteria bacterium]